MRDKPADFGFFSNHLLIGNAGSGQIAVYDADSERFDGLLRDANGHERPAVGTAIRQTAKRLDRAIGCSSLPV